MYLLVIPLGQNNNCKSKKEQEIITLFYSSSYTARRKCLKSKRSITSDGMRLHSPKQPFYLF